MRAILSAEPGWTVVGEASTGREALAQALELKPDVLVIDVSLPEMNGLEVTRQVLRAIRVAVLIVTMHDSDDLVDEALGAGALGYVLKADAGRTLAEAVRTILSKGQFISERVRGAADVETAEKGGAARLRRDHLTTREREVLQLLAEGQANKEIASTLGISTKTAETHRARIMSKLELHSMSELVRYAIRNRIIEP